MYHQSSLFKLRQQKQYAAASQLPCVPERGCRAVYGTGICGKHASGGVQPGEKLGKLPKLVNQRRSEFQRRQGTIQIAYTAQGLIP